MKRSSRLKFLIVMALLVVGGHAAYQYGHVAYYAYIFKDFMQQQTEKAAGTGKTSDWLEAALRQHLTEYDVPPDASLKAVVKDSHMMSTVRFAKPVALLPGYTYTYDFNESVTSPNSVTLK
jgi:hypothetical protein